ncbi:hypothetical protein BBM20_20090 [Vibrio parahaemolyticus]|nr:hypothetical protein [Vibrio parahaemolyticus]EGR2270315.1 hypothetical protein [Vibrio parahaemolyticus]ODY25548.1 hypothetical protein BBM20_20090 [Vibrio parahaemolyticus]TOB29759.1 hypothetical protein CGK09_03415 [Vibrio parahaemolyticus]
MFRINKHMGIRIINPFVVELVGQMRLLAPLFSKLRLDMLKLCDFVLPAFLQVQIALRHFFKLFLLLISFRLYSLQCLLL